MGGRRVLSGHSVLDSRSNYFISRDFNSLWAHCSTAWYTLYFTFPFMFCLLYLLEFVSGFSLETQGEIRTHWIQETALFECAIWFRALHLSLITGHPGKENKIVWPVSINRFNLLFSLYCALSSVCKGKKSMIFILRL